MVSGLDSGSSGPGSNPGRGTKLCSWARHFSLIVPFFTPAYKWVPANLMLELTLGWTRKPIQGEVEILTVASRYANQDKLRPDGPLGSYADYCVENLCSSAVKSINLLKEFFEPPNKRYLQLDVLTTELWETRSKPENIYQILMRGTCPAITARLNMPKWQRRVDK